MVNDLYLDGKKFSRDIDIPCHMVDKSYILKPSAFMDICQEMALEGAEKLGFGYNKIFPMDLAWVLSRMHFHFEKHPKWRDEGKITTWHKGINGLFYVRDYQLRIGDELYATATSSWVIINLKTRAMERPEVMAQIADPTPQDTDHAIEALAPKVRMPRGVEVEKVKEHIAAYSDLDFNGHVNNTRYLSWAMDCVDQGVAGVRPVRDVYINFAREIHEGDTVTLMRAVEGTTPAGEGELAGGSLSGDGLAGGDGKLAAGEGKLAYTIEGLVGGLSAFIVRIEF